MVLEKESKARKDIHSILIIGSGPIVIGQACEFDYSGNQAVQALQEEGYRVIVHNPNPASVMTIKGLADAVYMEPLDINHLCKIIEAEKPDAILPTMGGQTALNLAMQFYQLKLNDKYKVEFIGASIKSILLAEDRGLFKERMSQIGLESPISTLVSSETEALHLAKEIGFPLIIRPSFTLGGQGGAIVYEEKEFSAKIKKALNYSPAHTALIEESLLGYQEFEFEVVRDAYDNALIVCAIENMDPMGIHTGDSITVAPIQSLSDEEYQRLRTASIDIIRAVEVECGGSNVQLAYHPEKKRLLVIEMNPRVSRSSALASKATGFPIARCAAKLAVGFSLDEIVNEITKKTTAFFEPSLDYVAIKVPRFDLNKFKITELGTQMRSVGESLSLGRNFIAALNKALRAIELKYEGLDGFTQVDEHTLDFMVSTLHPLRLQAMYTILLRDGEKSLSYLREKTHYNPWFLHQLLNLANFEIFLSSFQKVEDLDIATLRKAKEYALTDKKIAQIITHDYNAAIQVFQLRMQHKIQACFHCVDTCAGEFIAETPYFYSTYNEIDEGKPIQQPAVAIIGSGPNRIGQGLEFDTCCTMAALSLRKKGYKVVMINSNPETVSTDFNISDRLYIEALHSEDVYEVLRKEEITKVIFQLGGQTPIRLLKDLSEKGIEVMSSSAVAIDEAEHREQFANLLNSLSIKQAPNKSTTDISLVQDIANEIGYPVLIRPSYVIGGQSMVIIYSNEELTHFIEQNKADLEGMHIQIDKFLEDAIEYDIDAVTDGESVFIGGVLQHIEYAGVHSGDSACIFQGKILEDNIAHAIYEASLKIAQNLGGGIRGLLNIQFASLQDELYVLEVNPRASRTVPFISKASNINLIDLVCDIWVGRTLSEHEVFKAQVYSKNPHIAIAQSKFQYTIKEAVFSFDRFDNVDPILSPEMKSTGESIGIGDSTGEAFAKASIAAGMSLPTSGTVFFSISKKFREGILPYIDQLLSLGFDLVCTPGTSRYFNARNRRCRAIYRVSEGTPNVLDEINANNIDFIVNILDANSLKAYKDDNEIRRTTIKNRIPYVTTKQALHAALEAIEYLKKHIVRVRKL